MLLVPSNVGGLDGMFFGLSIDNHFRCDFQMLEQQEQWNLVLVMTC
jgi:hypothetical protein